jgi:hypothetical protein
LFLKVSLAFVFAKMARSLFLMLSVFLFAIGLLATITEAQYASQGILGRLYDSERTAVNQH